MSEIKWKNMVIYPDGFVREFPDPDRDEGYTLEELQEVVGGPIQVVNASNNRIAICHEEGKIVGLDYNALATQVVGEDSLMAKDYMVGPVLFCQPEHVQ